MKKFSDFPFVEYRLYDVDIDPGDQGFKHNNFDIILATNSLHVARNITKSIKNLRSLISPGGLMILIESTKHWPWFDITTGLRLAAINFEDDVRNESPLPTQGDWIEILAKEDFSHVQTYPGNDSPCDIMGQHVIIAATDTILFSGSTEYQENNIKDVEAEKKHVYRNELLPELTREDLLDSSPEEQRNILNKYLCNNIGRVLRRQPNSLPTNVFLNKMGFDSLMAVELKNRLEIDLDIKVSLKSIIKDANINLLVEYVLQALTRPAILNAFPDNRITDISDYAVPLTPPQHWFFEHTLSNSHHWNTTQLIKMENIEVDLLEKSMEIVIQKHDVFRMRFKQEKYGWKRIVDSLHDGRKLHRIDLSSLFRDEQRAAMEKHCRKTQKSLNITRGPLVCTSIIYLGPEKGYRLLLVIHHLAFDGFSWLLLLEDIEQTYEQLKNGNNIQSPKKSSTYTDWAKSLGHYKEMISGKNDEFLDELEYWTGIHKGYMSSIPHNYTKGSNIQATQRRFHHVFSESQSKSILETIPAESSVTVQAILLSILGRVIKRQWNMDNILMETQGHGRDHQWDGNDISHTIGWCTTFYPILLEPDISLNFREELALTQRMLERIPEGGMNYGIMRYLATEDIRLRLTEMRPPEMKFLYHGHLFDQLAAGSNLFRPAGESIGPIYGPGNMPRYKLYVYFLVREGKLNIEIVYSKNIHRANTIDTLMCGIIYELEDILDKAN